MKVASLALALLVAVAPLSAEGKQGRYGSQEEAGYADTGFQKDGMPRYPLKKNGQWCPGRIKAAWEYIHKPYNAARYHNPQDVVTIKARIAKAWQNHVSPQGPSRR